MQPSLREIHKIPELIERHYTVSSRDCQECCNRSCRIVLENLAMVAAQLQSSFCRWFASSTETAGIPCPNADFCGMFELMREYGVGWRDEGFAPSDQRVRGIKK